MPSRRSNADLARFLRRLPLAVVIAAAIWFAIRPLYNPVICTLGQVVARAFEYPRVAKIVLDGKDAVIGRTDLRADSAWLKVSLTQIHFNIIPFMALFLAMPRPFSRGGLKALLTALGVLLLSHVVALLLNVKVYYSFNLGAWSRINYSDFARNIYGGLRYFFDIAVTFALPLLLWVGLFPERVFRLLGFDQETAARHAGRAS